MTLDFVVWAKAYVDANPDPIFNKENWESIGRVESVPTFKCEGVVASSDQWGNFL
jgi:hypothetical protein